MPGSMPNLPAGATPESPYDQRRTATLHSPAEIETEIRRLRREAGRLVEGGRLTWGEAHQLVQLRELEIRHLGRVDQEMRRKPTGRRRPTTRVWRAS